MDSVTYENLHYEHVQWLSEIDFWQEEIRFLEKLCHNMNHENGISTNDCLNQLAHHSRMLNNMKGQISSHENFLRDMLQEDGLMSSGKTLDHDHNREHMTHFQESFKKLKYHIYKISHPILS